MSEMKHSELPWRTVAGRIIAPDHSGGGRPSTVQVGVIGAFDDCELVPFNKERWQADCDLIVQAVNAHDDLVAALTEARAYVAVKAAQVNDFDEPLNDVAIEALAKIDAALAKAQPQKE